MGSKVLGFLVIATLAMIGCGQPAAPTTPTPVVSPAPAVDPAPPPPTPFPTPTGGSLLALTVVTVPFRAGIPGQIAYRVADTESLARLGFSASGPLSGPGTAVIRTDVSPASSSGTVTVTFAMAGTYAVTVNATTRDGRVVEETIVLHVEA